MFPMDISEKGSLKRIPNTKCAICLERRAQGAFYSAVVLAQGQPLTVTYLHTASEASGEVQTFFCHIRQDYTAFGARGRN